ncbi:condensation domain-containing protein [Flavilitoribacter nigricans]|uniref:Condensation domain-containing protein n=1 Tax=Flavilitoribacter nigricans (strain ATCC 23147 / DSM 23189 / NBRC 102662 / NCIMB 1420 / SS-2) TaxID=1122177 RepID=A0A2D0NGX9_FLAN2|nr:condensation domain-containing protein [Flavilitoribacter nigricans]PHN07752.1 hypothetical protein CRP01_04730 [Flavilitoribacter nigricans DSM 23189 = NBRC 102662]
MISRSSIVRKLNDMEAAFTWSNARLPLCVVCVLHLENAPGTDEWADALQQLQERHPLLRCGIVESGSRSYFETLDPVPPISFTTVDRQHAESWQPTATDAVNTSFDAGGPLMRCWLVNRPGEQESELIICFHHAIIDGASARLILHEILSLAGGVSLPEPEVPVEPPRFPAPYRRGTGLLKKMLHFAAFQLKDEWRYRSGGLANPVPKNSKNAIISLRLEADVSRRLSVKAGRAGQSLNTILLAAIAAAVIRQRYGSDAGKLARVLSFADLRTALEPSVSRQQMGCYISMLRLSVPLTDEPDIWQLAREIRRAMFQASRRGDVFLMSMMSKRLVQLAFTLKNSRLGIGAISFIGKLDLQESYGPVNLRHVRAFITNNQYGPELSAFGKVLFGSISLDFTYLTAETTHEKAAEMVEEIRQQLVKLAE